MAGQRKSLSWRHVMRLAALAAAAAGAIVILLVKATPEAARRTAPMGADAAAAARFDERVINQVGNVLLDKSGATRLDLEITEEMANARLSQTIALEERGGKAAPPILRDLRIAFEPGEIVLATRLGRGITGILVSQRLSLVLEPGGRLRVEMGGTRAGALPLPGVMTYVRQAVAAEVSRLEAAGADEKTVAVWRFLRNGLEGRPLPLGEGRKRIEVDSVDVERGMLKIRGHRAEAKHEAGADKTRPDERGG
jgi:hypothetical protein